ncbi:MAG: TOBE domain-containing protein [Planctomycetota bacterium]
MEGRVVESVYLGEVAQHRVEVSGGTILKILEINPAARGEVGDRATLSVHPDQVVILPD